MRFEALIFLDCVARAGVAVLGIGTFHQHDFSVSATSRVQAKQAYSAIRDDLVHGFAYHMAGKNTPSYRHSIRHRYPLLMLDVLQLAEATGSGPQVIEGDRIDVGLQRFCTLRKCDDIGFIAFHMPLQVTPQAVIACVDECAAYASQHDGSINVQYVLLKLIRVFDGLLSQPVMVIDAVDDDLIQIFVVANFVAENYPGVVQVIALGGMDATHFALGARGVDPIHIRAVPAQTDVTDLNVVQIGGVFGNPGP